MKKLIATAIAAGALAAGGAASAQDLGSVVANVLGLGVPSHSYGVQQQIYVDRHGRHFYYDHYGRQVFLQSAPRQIIGYDAWGRPIYGRAGNYPFVYGAIPRTRIPDFDDDGDGIANAEDRWPFDPRHS